MDYQSYLKSAHWKAFNRAYRKKHKRCEFCGSAIKTQLHHITYKRLGKERNTDVVLLCEDCHSEVHGLVNPSRDIRTATDIVRGRKARARNKYPFLTVRGKERKRLKESNASFRSEMWDAFDRAISE